MTVTPARKCSPVMVTPELGDMNVPRPQVVAKNACPSWLRNTSLTRTLGKPVPAVAVLGALTLIEAATGT